MSPTKPRKGMPSPRLSESEFHRRFLAQFADPAYGALAAELDKIAAAAWDGRKAPRTRKAAFSRASVQLPGEAAMISVAHFQAAARQSAHIRDLILRYKEALLAQVQQAAACNALHQLEARLARWLLQILDRVDDPKLPLTQEFMAQMLGVRRSTVTVLAGKLQELGLIRYHRGHVVVLDRAGLEKTACECYAAIRRRTDAVFTPAADA
jgi:hypothetical protein